MDLIAKDTLVEAAISRRNELSVLMKKLNKELDKAPRGYLRVSKKGKYWQYYLRSDPKDFNGKYVNKKNMGHCSLIAQRDYYLDLLKEISLEIESINTFLQAYCPDKMSNLYSCLHEGRKRIITPISLSDEEYINVWKSVDYEHKDFSANEQEIYTSTHIRVRSKTERTIAERLIKYNVPFLYEFPVKLASFGYVHTDFYCLNVRLRKDVAWEHFGMMDDSNYSAKAVKKIERYEATGFMPGDNFILTFESLQNALNINTIDKNIEKYLL